ncbi:MAG: glycosyltransferase family 2 protein [Bacteroidota bacterium]
MRFSIIIPTYNEEGYIGRCLRSIAGQEFDRSEFEIILSDAQSTDATATLAGRYADKIVSATQRGIAHGRNLGARPATGEILLFVDADVTLQPDFLRRLDLAFRNDNIVAVTGRAVPADGGWFARVVYHGTYALVGLFNAFGLPLFPGLCVAYRSRIFVVAGGFREDFGVTEDLDLSRRLSLLGVCRYEPQARAFVSTRRLRKHGLSTVLFHIYHDLRYLLTGKSAGVYPKSEEITSAADLWRMNRTGK